jgi:hypothetical protein
VQLGSLHAVVEVERLVECAAAQAGARTLLEVGEPEALA